LGTSNAEEAGVLLDHRQHLHVVVVTAVLLAVHVLHLSLFWESHDLGVHPVLVLHGESEVHCSAQNHILLSVGFDACTSDCSFGSVGRSVRGVFGIGPSCIVGVESDKLDDHADDHFDHMTVHPGHDVNLTSDAKHGKKLGDEEDG